MTTRHVRHLHVPNPWHQRPRSGRSIAAWPDNSVGRVIEGLLRAHLVVVDELAFAPLDAIGSQRLFRFVAAAYKRRSLGIASHWPFEDCGRFLPEHSTAGALLIGSSTTACE